MELVSVDSVDILPSIPAGFPEIPYPVDNAFTLPRWELGKALFFDKRLSKDSSISCATCHKPFLGFSDNTSVSNGILNRPGSRNVPSLNNVAYHPYYTREGGVATLEIQVLVPIQEHNEFGFNIVDIAERLATDSLYQQMSALAYNRSLDPYSIVRSIATFERSLVSGNSRFDQFQYANKQSALTGFEVAGMKLFYSSKTNCSVCHNGFNMTNYAFENNGLYPEYKDVGRARLTELESDVGRFKVPSLRNVEVTGPYMHDGSLASLEDVIEHYNTGGHAHNNKSNVVKPLDLTEIEKRQLVAFLKTLTDHEFLNNSQFRIP